MFNVGKRSEIEGSDFERTNEKVKLVFNIEKLMIFSGQLRISKSKRK